MIFFLFFFYILSFIIHLISFVTTCIVLQIFPKHVHHDNVQCSILQRHYIMYSQLLLTYSIIPDSFILQLIKSYHIETHSPHPITPQIIPLPGQFLPSSGQSQVTKFRHYKSGQIGCAINCDEIDYVKQDLQMFYKIDCTHMILAHLIQVNFVWVELTQFCFLLM